MSLKMIIEWIIFWQNSKIELNQIGYRTPLPGDEGDGGGDSGEDGFGIGGGGSVEDGGGSVQCLTMSMS